MPMMLYLAQSSIAQRRLLMPLDKAGLGNSIHMP